MILYEVTFRHQDAEKHTHVYASSAVRAWSWVVWYYATTFDEMVICERISVVVSPQSNNVVLYTPISELYV